MNKNLLFPEKIKQNSSRSKNKAVASTANKQSSYSNLFKPFSKFKKRMQSSGTPKLNTRQFNCDDCDMLNSLTSTENGDSGNKVELDRKTLDIDYIDTLVFKIKELRNRVQFFENHCGFDRIVCNSPMCHYYKEDEAIGDCNVVLKNSTRLKNKSSVKSNNNFVLPNDGIEKNLSLQFSSRPKTAWDRQRSIYTNNDAIVAPAIVQETYPRISKTQKNKSNASIVKSLHSIHHNNEFAKVHIPIESKTFHAAAEEFIKQAEELKSRIGYILECCGRRTPTLSRASVSGASSEFNANTCSLSSLNENTSDPHLKGLFQTVSSQYREILDSLVSIETQIKTLYKKKSYGKISEPQEARGQRMSERCSKSALPQYRRLSALTPDLPADLKKYTPDAEFKYVRTSSGNKVLEPVVMVYEPIHPESAECATARSLKGRRDDSKQKYGFVVTYTPDISPEADVGASDSKNNRKNKKVVKKKKIVSCLGI